MADAHIYVCIICIYVSAMLSEVEQWPCGGGCSPYDGQEVIYFCTGKIPLWNIHVTNSVAAHLCHPIP